MALYMQAYDTTFERLVFPYPEFQAKYTVELSQEQQRPTRQHPAGSGCLEQKWAISEVIFISH